MSSSIKEDHNRTARILLRRQVILAQKYLPFDHPKQFEYLHKFMVLYESHNKRYDAFKLASQILKKQEEDFGKIHYRVAETLIAIGRFNKACRILLESRPIDEVSMMKCLHLLSQSARKNENCLKWLEKWLAYLELNYPSTDRRIAYTLRQLASIHHDLEHPTSAWDYLHRSLQIYMSNQDHFNMRIIEDFMEHIKRGIGGLHIAYVICKDYWENRYLFYNDIDHRLDMPAPPIQVKTE